MAGGPGFEPGLTESESAVLPLNDPPNQLSVINYPLSIINSVQPDLLSVINYHQPIHYYQSMYLLSIINQSIKSVKLLYLLFFT